MEKFRENRLDDEQKGAFDGLPLDTKLSYYQDYKAQQMQRLEYALSQMTKGERAEVEGLTFDQQVANNFKFFPTS
jgi:secreted trypsin-like serine protease